MKIQNNLILAAAVGSVWMAVCLPGVHAQTIGVQFVNGGSGINTGAADALPPGTTAGVSPYAQANWNNLGQYGGGVTLNDSTGAATALSINWDSGGTSTTGASGLGTGDGDLMDGFIYTWQTGATTPLADSVYGSAYVDKPLIYLGGLQAWTTQNGASGYVVVLYTTGYTYYEETEYWIGSATGNPLADTMVTGADLTAHLFNGDSASFSGTYVPISATATNTANEAYGANYAVFTGLTNDAILIRCHDVNDGYSYGAGVNGFQIIPIYASTLIAPAPTFSPSATVYADSPVVLNEAATGGGVLKYQWQTDGGSGGSLTNIPGATSTNLLVTPPDIGSGYTINYDVVVANASGSVTSAVAALTVNAATAPFIVTDISPSLNLVAFAGGTASFSASFNGTEPIAYNWQSNSVNLLNATNPTLTLANLQLSESATYQLDATNAIGTNSSSAATLTVLPDPAAPAASQKYAYMVLTNHPWAYWRLNETNDPTDTGGVTNYMAYDYSGHGFDPIYGEAVTVNNTGPQPPSFPGFAASEIAAGTAFTTGGYLTAPALNLAGNTNVTFMVWINPNSAQLANVGLLFNRGGPDSACGFGYGGTPDHLGYTWDNNSAASSGWDSGLAVADGQWNFVAYVISPTNATVYLGNLNGGTTNFFQASNAGANTSETFNGGTVLLGSDANNLDRTFNGLIAEAALFTNALTTAQVQRYFLAGIGAQALVPTVTAATASPSANVYSGQNVLLNATASGTAPLAMQWQAGPDGSTWTNLPGATASTVLVNPLLVGTVYYQLLVSNQAGTTASASVAVTYNALPAAPAGLWTANFQITNNIVNYSAGSSGTGRYVGRGILGNGTYWNVIPDVMTALYEAANLASVSDLQDDGATHTGVYCDIYEAAGYSSSTVPLANASDIGNVLDQYATIYSSPGALQFKGVPDGTYNLAIYESDGTFGDRGSTFVVYDAVNGNQTLGLANATPETALAQGNNVALFTNVHVGGGTLVVDVDPTGTTVSNPSGGNTEADINAAQLQLISYDSPAPSIMLNSAFTATNSTLTVTWPEGILQTATNLLGPWTPVYAPSPITITTTNAVRFFRAQVQ
jgi:hypothetical protein